jgi:hypothetical protein
MELLFIALLISILSWFLFDIRWQSLVILWVLASFSIGSFVLFAWTVAWMLKNWFNVGGC